MGWPRLCDAAHLLKHGVSIIWVQPDERRGNMFISMCMPKTQLWEHRWRKRRWNLHDKNQTSVFWNWRDPSAWSLMQERESGSPRGICGIMGADVAQVYSGCCCKGPEFDHTHIHTHSESWLYNYVWLVIFPVGCGHDCEIWAKGHLTFRNVLYLIHSAYILLSHLKAKYPELLRRVSQSLFK